MNTRQDTLPMPDPAAFCSVQYAAAKLGRDERTVRRWISEGILTAYSPRVAPTEQKKTMLWVAQVTDLRVALDKINRPKTDAA